MNVREIPVNAVDRYLRLVRFPLDTAAGLLPGNGRGAEPSARIALDRAEARVRGVLGFALRMPSLREDAQRLRQTAAERRKAVELRGKAARRRERAESNVEERQEQTAQQRKRAAKQTQARRQQATRRRRTKVEEARQRERQGLQANSRVAAEAQQEVQEREPAARLEATEVKSEALQARELELTARDEARRLADASAAAKAERKQDQR